MFLQPIISTSILPGLIVSLLSWSSPGMNHDACLTGENGASAELTDRQAPRQQTVFFGTLLGADGRPMRKANVLVERFNNSKPLASAEVDPQGRFKLTTRETGLLGIRFSGTDHQSHKMILIVDKPLRVNLDVKLKSYDYKESISEVRIIGDFNNFSVKSGRVMERRSDGTYFADFRVSTERFAYQLLGVTKDGESINGTQSDDYVYDGGGDYRSIVLARNGSVSIVFDPNKLNRSAATEQVQFKNKRVDTARFVAFYDAMMRRRDELHKALVAYRRTGLPLSEFQYDWSHDLMTLEREVSSEKRPLIRQLLLFSYLDIGFGNYGAKLNAKMAREALGEIPSDSPLWSIEPTLVGVAIDAAGDSQRYISYVQEIIGKHSDPSVVKIIRATLSPDRQIAVGKMAPNFSFVAFEDDAGRYTRDNLKGKTLLIDFWATWCVPCIEEMPNLHKEYDKFKAQGFEILSVSLDEKPELVKEFRKAKWKMPWLHTLLSSNPEVRKQFEIVGIPKGVLIDITGRIVATDRDLRGKKLHETLTKLLNLPH
jgi:thiol-disulfide isomerase/thioredoxin